MIDVGARLTAPDLRLRAVRLGFRGDDLEDLLEAAHTAARSTADIKRIELLASRLGSGIGSWEPAAESPWHGDAAQGGQVDAGVLAMLTFLVTADEVRQFHRSRGIVEDISWASLSDLGQQTWVHRQTYGEFGLHTQEWLRIAWSGALYWLGRLQFNLQRDGDEWVLSTHIPGTGPLTRASVDDSFRQARTFFATHFGDYPTTDFHCSSWLLDPELAAVLPPESNMVHFQRRWRLYGEPMRADADALFFTFYRRGDVDLDALPRRTTLQRAIADRLRAGQHWSVWQGRLAQAGFAPSTTAPAGTRAGS